MKKSKYNILTRMGLKNYILHNMITKNTVILNRKEYKTFKNNKMKNNELLENMLELGFYVNDNIDETKVAIKNNIEACNDYSFLNITLIPSFSCNLKCKYCYQNGSKIGKLELKEQKAFVKFVKNRLIKYHSKAFHLSWFGGEPLLFINIIESVCLQLKTFCEKNRIIFTSSISSNLTLFDEKIAQKLKYLNVIRMETTLAGLEKEHNILRPSSNGQNLYKKTLKAIALSSEYFLTMLNINFCKDNYLSVKRLLKVIAKLKLKNLYVNFNEIINYKQNRAQVKQFLNIEKKKFLLFSLALKLKLNVCDITNFCGEPLFCPQYHCNSFAIDYKLNVYKCTEKFDESTKYGEINVDSGELELKKNITNKIDNKCFKCDYFPYCNGGCEIKRKQKKLPCPSELCSVNKYLKMFVKRESLK